MSERDDETPNKSSRDAPRRDEHSGEAASGDAASGEAGDGSEPAAPESPEDESISAAREGDAGTQVSGPEREPEHAASGEIHAGRAPRGRGAEASEDAKPGQEESDHGRSSDSAEAETAGSAEAETAGSAEAEMAAPPGDLEEGDEIPEVPPWADDLPALAGARPRRSAEARSDTAKRKPRISARGAAYLGGGLGAAAFVAWLVALSWANSSGYYVVCEPDTLRAERGRWLPWGRASMDGPKWEPIPIPPDGDCAERELDTEAELAERFTRALLERSSAIVRGGEEDPDLAVAERQLEQAMLLSRGRQNGAARKKIGRLRGDLAYLRAADELDAAIEQVDAAAETFSEAAEREPLHHEDASAWAEHTRDISAALRAGPGTKAPSAADAEDRAAEAFAGDAEEEAPTLGPDPIEGSAAAHPDSAPPAPAEKGEESPKEGNAGSESHELDEDLPQGGVLL